MASTVVENAMSVADFPSLSHAPEQHTSEPSHLYNIEDKTYSESFSVYRSSNSITKSESPGGNFDYSSFNTQNRDCANKNGEQMKSYLEDNSVSSKSTYSSYDFEKILNDSALQQRLKQEPGSQSSIEELLGGNFDSYKSKTLALEKPAENKWDFKTDYTSYSGETKSTNGGRDKINQKYEKFSNADLNSNDYKSKSQSFDFEQLMQTYGCEASKDATITPETELDASKKLETRPSYGFEASDAAMRLRNSVQSNFLSSELWKAAPPKPEDIKSQGCSAVRTIEEILKQHGISDNIPQKSSNTVDDTGKKAVNSSTMGQTNLSQNNENSSGLIKGTGLETGQSFFSMQDKDSCNMLAISGNKDMNSSFRTDPAAGSSRADPKNFTSQGTTSFTVNTSQNNETTKPQNTVETDPLKRYGSSVDYNSSTGKYNLQSGSTNFRMYDFGKSTSLSGDNTRTSMLFSTLDSKKFEGSTDMSKFDAAQADGTPKFNASKASHIDIIKNMGSATDALEYSMSTERQRLRKLDTLISATPVNYSSLEVPRSLRAQYLSPERTYSSLMSSDLPSRRIYSTSNMASTSAHGAGYSTRNHMSRSVDQRDSSTTLNKSISAPGSAGMQSVAMNGSSVDGRPMYWPYGSKRDFNRQYNNAYNPQLLEKLVNQKNDNNQKKLPGSKKKECPLKSKKEECNKRNDHLLMYQQNPSGINFLNNSQMKKPVTGEKKKVSGKLETKKKTDKDFNHSKTMGGMYDAFDFVKDLNRMWQETVFGQAQKPAVNAKGKYMPYKPASQDKKEAKPANGQGSRDMFGKDLWQPSIQRSDSNWTLTGSTEVSGKLGTYGRDYGLQSVPKVRSQSSLGAPVSGQTKNKGNNSSLVKNRLNTTSAMMTKQPPVTPKSILKQPNNSKPVCLSSSVGRPQSSLATSSKSCTQTAYPFPYHLMHSFSPVEPHKASRCNTSALVKKQEPPTSKRLSSRPGTISKQGRRI